MPAGSSAFSCPKVGNAHQVISAVIWVGSSDGEAEEEAAGADVETGAEEDVPLALQPAKMPTDRTSARATANSFFIVVLLFLIYWGRRAPRTGTCGARPVLLRPHSTICEKHFQSAFVMKIFSFFVHRAKFLQFDEKRLCVFLS